MSFLIAHISDPHLGPLPKLRKGDLGGKRLTGYVNWKRRKHIHNMDALARVVADLRAQRPDHVAMTGDVVNLGLPDEFLAAAHWMATLGEPDDVSFTPGNHDAYVESSAPWMASALRPWMRGDMGEGGVFPYLRERGGVALIGVSSAIPTAPFLASGRVGEEQLGFLSRMLELTRARGLPRVIMIHHPPWRGGATPGRGLRDAREFEKVVAAHGAELIIHGHNHRTQIKHVPGPGGPIPVIGVKSASAVPGTPRHLAGYNLYRLEKIGGVWRIEARSRGLTAGDGPVVELEKIEI